MESGQGILSLAIKEKTSLYAAFIPFVKNGGLFIPTSRAYKLGDEVFMLLNLMDESERIPVAGKVIWITPRGTGGSRTPGIGVQFGEQDKGDTRNRIENLLGVVLQSDKPTYTM
jgi:type IV pilus assembly protein PilZ